MWELFRKTTSQPLADQPPVPALTRHKQSGVSGAVSAPLRVVTHSQDAVVPEDTDGFGALLCGDQAELHGDGFVQRVLQQLVVVVHGDADHRGVDHRTLRDPKDTSGNLQLHCLL